MIRLKDILNEDLTTDGEKELMFDSKWKDRGIAAANTLYTYGKPIGMTKMLAAAFIGNFAVESSVRPNVQQNLTGGMKLGWGFIPTTPEEAANQPTQMGYGLAQWTRTRRESLLALGAETTNDQLKFVVSELQGVYKNKWAEIKKSTDIAEATTLVATKYEQAGKPNDDRRIKYAEQIYNSL